MSSYQLHILIHSFLENLRDESPIEIQSLMPLPLDHEAILSFINQTKVTL